MEFDIKLATESLKASLEKESDLKGEKTNISPTNVKFFIKNRKQIFKKI